MGRANKQLQESLGYLSNKLSKIVLKHVNHEFMRKGYNLTWDTDGQQQQQLAEKLSKDKTTVARLIKSVEKLNLVERVANSDDKREKQVYLTQSGEKIIKKLTNTAQGVLRKAQTGIDPADLDTCKKVLRRVHETLSEELN
jgi:DNA-binding MarR family transcriptional regulator